MERLNQIYKMNIQVKVRLSPYFTQNLKVGVENLLNKALLKFIPSLRGIFLAYENLALVDSCGIVVHEACETHFRVQCDALVFVLERGSLLTGIINKVSNNHIGLLVHGLFNASIAFDKFPTGLSFDSESSAWVFSDNPISKVSGKNRHELRYQVGTKVAFEVESMHTKAGLISILGNMNLGSGEKGTVFKLIEKAELEKQRKNENKNKTNSIVEANKGSNIDDGSNSSGAEDIDNDTENDSNEQVTPLKKRIKKEKKSTKKKKKKSDKSKKKKKKTKNKKSKEKLKTTKVKRKAADIES